VIIGSDQRRFDTNKNKNHTHLKNPSTPSDLVLQLAATLAMSSSACTTAARIGSTTALVDNTLDEAKVAAQTSQYPRWRR
jgi:hypothetical protein